MQKQVNSIMNELLRIFPTCPPRRSGGDMNLRS